MNNNPPADPSQDSMEKDDPTYPTSTNYDRLFTLLSGGAEVVCFVNYYDCRDICRARVMDGRIQLGVRGCEYGRIRRISEREKFISECAEFGLTFIDPQDTAQLRTLAARQQEALDKAKGHLQTVLEYVRGHAEPGYECVLCLVEAQTDDALAAIDTAGK